MKMVRLCVCLSVVLTLAVVDAASITNKEIFDILTENAEPDEQEYSITDEGDDVMSVEDDDVIELLGNPDDEADIEAILHQLGLLKTEDDGLAKVVQNVGGACSCRKDTCACCLSKKVTLTYKKKEYSTSVIACVAVTYVPSKTAFILTFQLNHRTVYHKAVSLKHLPKICARRTVGFIKTLACLDFYNVDVSNKRLCARLIGMIDFRIKKLYYSWGIACFKIPVLDDDWMKDVLETTPTAEAVINDEDVSA